MKVGAALKGGLIIPPEVLAQQAARTPEQKKQKLQQQMSDFQRAVGKYKTSAVKEAFLPAIPGAIGGVAGALRAGEGKRWEGAKAGAKGATMGVVKALPESALAAAGGAAGGALVGGGVPGALAGGASMGLGTLAASGGMGAYDEYQKAMEELERRRAQQQAAAVG